jgi:hypothetical protein
MLVLLRDLQVRVGPAERTRIEDVIASVSADLAEAAAGPKDTPGSAPGEEMQDGERDGSTVSFEYVRLGFD